MQIPLSRNYNMQIESIVKVQIQQDLNPISNRSSFLQLWLLCLPIDVKLEESDWLDFKPAKAKSFCFNT